MIRVWGGIVTRDGVVIGRIKRVGWTWRTYDIDGGYLDSYYSRGRALAYLRWLADDMPTLIHACAVECTP